MNDIKGYEGLYSITRDGKVWSHERIVKKGNHYYKQNEKWLKICYNTYGYSVISLSKNNKRPQYHIHRLVANAFIPNPENKPQINHINGIKTDNRVVNLEWCTSKENIQHAWKSNLRNSEKIKGEKNGMSKLTQIQVNEMRDNHVNRKRGEKPWEKYGIQYRQYHKIIKKESWKCVE